MRWTHTHTSSWMLSWISLLGWIESWTASVEEFSWGALQPKKRSINSIVQLNWVEKFGNDTNDVYTRHVFCCVVHKKKQNSTVLVVRVMSYFKSLTAIVVHRRWTNDNFYFLLMIVVPRRLFSNWILHTVGKGASKRITYLERNERRKRKLVLGVKQNMGR